MCHGLARTFYLSAQTKKGSPGINLIIWPGGRHADSPLRGTLNVPLYRGDFFCLHTAGTFFVCETLICLRRQKDVSHIQLNPFVRILVRGVILPGYASRTGPIPGRSEHAGPTRQPPPQEHVPGYHGHSLAQCAGMMTLLIQIWALGNQEYWVEGWDAPT